MSEGHANARFYPIGLLWAEREMARRRVNQTLATQGVLTQAAIVSVIAGKPNVFEKHLKRLRRG